MSPSNSRDVKHLLILTMAVAFGLALPQCAVAQHCPDGMVVTGITPGTVPDFWLGNLDKHDGVVCGPAPVEFDGGK